MVTTKSHQDEMIITLLPNRSATMTQTRIVIYVVAGFVLLIGLAWTLAGAYLILPFAGIEVGLFAYLMHKICKSTYEKEVITIGKERITIHSGLHSIERTQTMKRQDTQVVVVEPENPRQPIELNLTDFQSNIEVGNFLNQSDRLTTRQALKQAGLTENNRKWWLSEPTKDSL